MKKVFLCVFALALLVATIVPVTACAEAALPSISAKEAVLMSEDGHVLFEQNATEKRPIASMTKIMTLLCTYEAIDSGKASLNDDVVASERAASMGGSQVFLDAHATYKLEQLIKSIVVCSANDSCVAVAEHLCGNVEGFVQQMNDKAKQLQLVATHFENCTGLPAVSQYSCARDVGVMLSQLIKHPHYFACAKIWMEDFVHPSGRVTGMTNTNKLIRFYDGCDGGKTGYTSEAQHCLAATAKRGDTRIIAVVVGAPDSKTRFKEVSSMFNYAFANYESKVYADCNTRFAGIAVEGGKTDTLDISAQGRLVAFGKKGSANAFRVEMNLPETVKAPIKMGDKVGTAQLKDENGRIVAEVDIVAASNVEAKTYWDFVKQIVTH